MPVHIILVATGLESPNHVINFQYCFAYSGVFIALYEFECWPISIKTLTGFVRECVESVEYFEVILPFSIV